MHRHRHDGNTWRSQLLFMLLSVLSFYSADAWQSPKLISTGMVPLYGTTKKTTPQSTNTNTNTNTQRYTISYSPNFHRHIVSTISKNKNGTSVQKEVLRSFDWLDEAQRAYPTARLEPLDLPPPPRFVHGDQNETTTMMLSRIVAGAGVHEMSVYYEDKERNSQDTTASNNKRRTMTTTTQNNGGSYLLKFLQKLYSDLPTITAAEIHRGVMDKFPALAIYDAALVHERLFFLLAPLPPDDVLAQLVAKTAANNIKKTKKKAKAEQDFWDGNNVTCCFGDFPTLFYKHGYGAGLTQGQLVQALQSLPQFWLPMYLDDASVSCKKPQDILPYLVYHLSSHPEALSDTNNQLDPLLTGVPTSDVASLVHAKSALGLSWGQCRFLLLALPTLRTCETQPSWDLFLRGPVRSTLIEESLTYLRLRLQLDPSQVLALVKTHTRLSNYRFLDRLKPVLDALQTQLDLDSEELKRLILRMPQMLGIATSTLEANIDFFTERVGLTKEELKKSVLRLPALLQYSRSNLQAKLRFLRDDLEITEQESIVKMMVAQPILWGLSLEENLRPKAESLGRHCDLSLKEVGEMVANAPDILVLNWKSNLKPTLQFLTERLELTPSQLSDLVQASPRILLQSIHKSLEHKIALLEEHESRDQDTPISVRGIILARPALLITTKSQLLHSLQKSTRGQGKKTIVQMAVDGTVVHEFLSVKDAATTAGTSISNMYAVIREGKILGEMKYLYGNRSAEPGTKKRKGTKLSAKASKDLPLKRADDASLSVYVSGRVYPPDGVSQNIGLRRAGGMAIAIPSIPDGLSEALFNFAFDECCRGQARQTKDPRNDDQGGLLVQLGYAYLRPSRRRASLYACLVALRVVTQAYLLASKAATKSRRIWEEKGTKAPPPPPSHIHIITDSNYVADLLQSSTKLLEWGSKPSCDEFQYNENGSKNWVANPDITYPLSCTYSRLVDPMGMIVDALQANLTVSFSHVTDGRTQNRVAANCLREDMGDWAKEAAEWQYKRSFVIEKSNS